MHPTCWNGCRRILLEQTTIRPDQQQKQRGERCAIMDTCGYVDKRMTTSSIYYYVYDK